MFVTSDLKLGYDPELQVPCPGLFRRREVGPEGLACALGALYTGTR